MDKRVLIVDDDATNRDLISRALNKDNYIIREARDGREALAMVEDDRPDLIVLDIMMPGMSGYQVCEAIRSREANKAVKVLFLSARKRETAKGAADFSGGDDYMEKPFSPRLLRERVGQLLAK